ncbi:MAG: hypothetical protein V7647_432 [Acidobacteriota bacterium]
MDTSERVADIAGAILDGTPVDWHTAHATANETERQLLDQMRVLATLADFHRNQSVSDDVLCPPDTWGHISVLEAIGSGACGDVYRAWDTRLDREVALKLLPAGSDSADKRASSIIQEGRLLARVRHPNVVTIYGAERIGDTVGLWMERIDGETVEQRLAHEPPLQASTAIEIGIQVCHAVSAVHKAGLLHRDIKAQNVMLATDGRAVVMDFGTGWEVGQASVPLGSLAGTPLYLAPEVLRGGQATVHSDIYSIGVLLYRMVTRTYPVQGRNLHDLRLAHEHHERIKAAGVPRDVPRRLGRIIDRAIDPSPERRYDTADALAAALAAVKRQPAVTRKYATAAFATLLIGALLLAGGRLLHVLGPNSTQAAVSLQPGGVRASAADVNSLGPGQLVRLTTSSGVNIDPSLSPDGSLLAYASDRAGTGGFDIWVQPIAGGNPIRITNDPGDEIEPSFSPDGTSIVFCRSETGGIYVVGVSGGKPRQLVGAGRVHSPRFSPDGRSVLYWTGQTVWTARFGTVVPDAISAVHTVRSDGRAREFLTPGFVSARNAIWSPEGNRILFLGERKTDGSRAPDWYVVRPGGGDPVRTGAVEAMDKAGVTGVPIPGAWTRNGDVVFTTATEDNANIWQLSISPETGRVAGVPRRLTFGTAVERSPTVRSPGQLAFSSSVENVAVWRVPLDQTTGMASGGLERVTDDGAADRLQNVSADGRVVAFTSSRTKPAQVWLKDMQTGRERQITHSEEHAAQLAQMSPDGSRVAVNVEGRRGMELYPSNGGQPSTLCTDCIVGGWSSDGSQMLIERGTQRLVLEIGSSREVPLAERPNWYLNSPRFSRDGRWVVFHTTNAPELRQVYAVPAFLAAAVPPDKWVPVVTDFGIQPSWSPDGTGVYHFSVRDGFFCVWLQPVDVTTKRPTGEPKAVLHLHDARLRAALRAMPTNDVQGGYLYMTLTEVSSNIWMLDTRGGAPETGK